VLACGPALSVGIDNGLRPGRACDPYKSRHYEAALRSSKSDDVTTPERDLATIIRESEPTILNFELIKHLAARWEERGMSVPSE